VDGVVIPRNLQSFIIFSLLCESQGRFDLVTLLKFDMLIVTLIFRRKPNASHTCARIINSHI
jgi:hypothetical protein